MTCMWAEALAAQAARKTAAVVNRIVVFSVLPFNKEREECVGLMKKEMVSTGSIDDL